MAFPKKHHNSSIRSFRMPMKFHLFFKENFKDRDNYTANDFIINLVSESEEYKSYLKRKLEEDKELTLFD